MAQTFQSSVQNPNKDTHQTNYAVFVNNLSFSPTVEELNRSITSGGELSQTCSPVQEVDDPMFGTHIREAATTVKKLFHAR